MLRGAQKFEVGIKAFIVKNDKLLVLKEKGQYYSTPGGRIDIGEESLPQKEVLLREIKEELGENLEVEMKGPVVTWIRKKRQNGFIFLVGFICFYKSGEIKLSDEHIHIEYRFVDNENWKKLNLAPGYYDAFEQFFQYFSKKKEKNG